MADVIVGHESVRAVLEYNQVKDKSYDASTSRLHIGTESVRIPSQILAK